MKFNLCVSHYGYMYGDKDMLNAPDSHAVNDCEERRCACSYFVFYSEPAGDDFFLLVEGLHERLLSPTL